MVHQFFLTFGFVSAGLAALTSPSLAQSRQEQSCAFQRELIFQMAKAEYGSYNVWDASFGEMDTDERFVSAVVTDNGNVVAVSELTALGKPNKSLQLVEFDDRGRTIWDVSHALPGLSEIKKILRIPEGYAVLGNIKGKSARISPWLGFFDKTGKLTAQKNVTSNGPSLIAESIIAQIGNSGFLLSASEIDEKKKTGHAVLYHLDRAGKVTDRHAYMPGLDNRLFNLSAVGKDAYLASGYLRGEDGRAAGWILKLNKDGSLMWQQQYPRGAAAQVNFAVPMVKDYILAAGETTPLNKGSVAAWVMMMDGTGNMVWQRYYTDAMNQSARDILVNMEGLATVLVQNTKPDNVEPSEDTQDFIRLLTVNERGVLTKSDEYFDGDGAQATQMIGGRAGERILAGRTDIVYKIEPKPGEPVETLRHGWDALLVAATPMEPFVDECLNLNPFSP